MTPATIIKCAQADGVILAVSPKGGIKAVGKGEAVNRWLPVIRQHKAELLDELRAANDGVFEAFEFAQNGEYAVDQEAHRQRCWQAFQNNAKRILAAPRFNRDALINQYRAEACARYGEATAADMAISLRNWIDVRGVH